MASALETLREHLATSITGTVHIDGSVVDEQSEDFGRLITKRPPLVVRPASVDDIVAVVRLANEHGFSVHTRGGLHSQSGQALTDSGIALDLRAGFHRVLAVDAEAQTVSAEAGCLWSTVVEATMQQQLAPKVLTNNLNVTVGGTLSMGGLGTASFRYGTQGDNVVRMKVVTGSGELIECSPESTPELFWNTFATLGQLGIIVEATISLKPVQPDVRTFCLLYDDIEALHRDAQHVMSIDTFDYIEGWCSPCIQGMRQVGAIRQGFAEWFYPLHLTVEHTKHAPSEERALAELSPYRVVHVEDQTSLDYFSRMESVFQIWKMAGTWENTHPWMESIMPWSASPGFIREALRDFPPGALMGGHILLWPCRSDVSLLPLFMHPSDTYLMGFGLLPSLPKQLAPLVLPRLEMLSASSLETGAKRYLSGWLNFQPADWQRHYGEKWGRFQELKRTWDPNNILNRDLIPGLAEVGPEPTEGS